MRIVIDTNVVIAAARSRKGASNALLTATLGGQEQWLCSVPLFLEYEEVLLRAGFLLNTGHSKAGIAQFLSGIASVIEPVDLHFLWRPQLRDPKDEMVLETAANGRADLLVTHNVRDFRSAEPLFEFELATPAEALRRIRS